MLPTRLRLPQSLARQCWRQCRASCPRHHHYRTLTTALPRQAPDPPPIRKILPQNDKGRPQPQARPRAVSLLSGEEDPDARDLRTLVRLADINLTVLVLNAASASLLESDFFRLSPQGRHVDGWARGIVKVIRARSHYTKEPRGQYWVFFERRAAAEAYAEGIKKRHALARSTFLLSAERNKLSTTTLYPLPDPLPATAQPPPEAAAEPPSDANVMAAEGTQDVPPTHPLPPPLATPSQPRELSAGEADAIAAYTLLPPSADLDIAIYSARDLHAWILEDRQQRLSITKADVFPVPEGLWKHLRHESVTPNTARVLFRLEGSKVTCKTVRQMIVDDGEARNLAWRLHARDSAVTPLQFSRSELREREYDATDEDSESPSAFVSASQPDDVDAHESAAPAGAEEGFSQFVLLFNDTAEARRFVRVWHRRELKDPRTKRAMVANTTGLW